ncbi:hypothetical protein MexAM1_META2p0895 (plasmid) [Methylorubrum extorquens AM1]|uniref:Uncharacterized protein n=1 Tax=Methylorubrum extorquens (strain ATCC 14718 / DSM 1338 / JCM 2805 / NCIMB 9133 / AM1) TaxID=272630 RepID=C5B5I6_METEA|nr:hypothetical protein MexAM1_META2p0895 [Methylorubrum extorquens AM1]
MLLQDTQQFLLCQCNPVNQPSHGASIQLGFRREAGEGALQIIGDRQKIFRELSNGVLAHVV